MSNTKFKPAVLFSFALALVAGTASATPIRWNIGYVNAHGSLYLATLKTVPARIAAATHGRLKIVLYDTLVAGPDQPAAVRDGRLDGSFAVTPWLSATAPYLNFGALPGLITHVQLYHRMLNPLLRSATAKIWREKYNAVQLMTGVFEEQCVLSKVPLRTPAAFAGLKVRVHNVQAGELMAKLGAAPTPVPFGEIVPALQRGIVDAVMTSVGTANGFGFYTVAKYVSLWKIGTIVPWSLIINEQTWNKLPADLKPVVKAEFRRIENAHFARYRSFTKEAIDSLVSHGMTLYRAPPNELAKMFAPANVDAVYQNWYKLNDKAGTDGRGLVKQIRALKARLTKSQSE